jgi:phosphoribosylglycinamide formyltransferase-1
MAKRQRVVALVSGRGSNLQALLDAAADPAFPAEIVHVISNKPDAYGLQRAHKAGVSTSVIRHKDYPDRESFDAALDTEIKAHHADLVCLAGFMRILTEGFVNKWKDRMLNIHPSILPSFKGLNTHERALEAGVLLHGCTVHFVRAAMDDGPIIAQAAVQIVPDDTPDTLAARVLVAEHKIYPLALKLVAEGHAKVSGDVVRFSGVSTDGNYLITPELRS